MIDFTTRLQKELDTQLLEIEAQEEDFIIKTQKSKDCINQTLALLKTFILQYQFKSKEEEILFFKEIKPDIFSKSVYYKKIEEIESLCPIGSCEAQEKYLKEQLEELTRFFNTHKEFYQYYRKKSTNLDGEYFIRYKNKSKSADIDENFSTKYDYTVAKIIAFDQLEIYLKEKIEKNTLKSQNLHVEHLGDLGKFRWTGKKIDLQELTYALVEAKVINNGECTINELADLFEHVFNFELKDSIYHGFQEIKRRINPTKFIEKLGNILQRKIEKDDENA